MNNTTDFKFPQYLNMLPMAGLVVFLLSILMVFFSYFLEFPVYIFMFSLLFSFLSLLLFLMGLGIHFIALNMKQ